MKAGQMEGIRLSERSSRKADSYEADIAAQIDSHCIRNLLK
jgi:hypothetical protein